jgi:hypothetical protein
MGISVDIRQELTEIKESLARLERAAGVGKEEKL